MDNNKPVSVLDNDAYFSWLKTPTCPSCSMDYVVFKLRDKIRKPFLLPCSHTICEKCIFSTRHFVKCPECGQTYKHDKTSYIRAQFDYHYALLGNLWYLENSLGYELTNFYNNSSNVNLPGVNSSEKYRFDCCECNTKTDQKCTTCKVYYCVPCFKKIHSIARALSLHKLAKDSKKEQFVKASDEEVFCNIHISYKLCYFCTDCQQRICEDCKFDHDEHQLSSIVVENRTALPKLRGMIDKFQKIKENISKVHQDTAVASTRLELHASSTAQEISSYFTFLHGQLQNIEKKTMLDLRKNALNHKKKINCLQESLNSIDGRLNNEIAKLNNYITDVPQNKYLTNIIKNAELVLENIEIPENDIYKENPFKFDKSLNYIFEATMNSNKQMNFNKQTKDNFDSSCDYLIGPENPQAFENRGTITPIKFNQINRRINKKQYSSNSASLYSLPSIGKPSSIGTSIVNPLHFNIQWEAVKVSHIRNPNHFYIQRNTYSSVEDEFMSTCKKKACFSVKPKTINLNYMYLVQSKDLWYRAQTITKTDNNNYKVIYIDYGNEEVVPVNRFREITEDLKCKPNGAILCSFYNIAAANGEWTDHSSQLMSEMILKYKVLMTVLMEGDINLIDLTTSSNNNPTSIRDALIYFDFGKNISSKNTLIAKKVRQLTEYKVKVLNRQTKKFQHMKYKEGEFFKVVISNVVSPDEFYVIKASDINEYEKLSVDLNEHYNAESGNQIYLPQVNMVCAAHYNELWHRGRIIRVLEKGLCDVWLVDLGTMKKIQSKNLRVLENKFLGLAEAAVNCSLSDIKPMSDSYCDWSKEAIEEFKMISQYPCMQMFLNQHRDEQYEVSLYVNKKDSDISINGLLVKKRLAISTGPESAKAEYTVDPLLRDIKNEVIEVMDYVEPKKPTGSKLRIMVDIMNVISPGQFYVSVTQHSSSINRMHLEIQNIMKNFTPQIDYIWNEGDNCYARTEIALHQTKCWYRAEIVSIDGNKYKVFLKDYGEMATVDIKELSNIDSVVATITNGSIECHLACVQPTGGSDTWTLAAKDQFLSLTSKFEAYGISLQGNHIGASRAVILWGMINQCDDPLAPSQVIWTNINNMLVKRGYVHLTTKFQPLTADESMNCELAVQGSEMDNWLQMNINDINDCVDKMKICNNNNNNNELSENESTDKSCQYEMNTDVYEIDEWIPAEPMDKTIFSGISTFVDNNAVIYMHDSENIDLMKRIKVTINQKFNPKKSNPNFVWKNGKPCLAQYHLDQLYYRAVVLKVKSKNEIKVQFVDYGNIETCTPSELCSSTILTNIPIQAKLFCLRNLKPISNNGHWTLDALDYIHKILCSNIGMVRIVNNVNWQSMPIVPCDIRVAQIDIRDEVINMGFGEQSEDHVFGTNADILYDPLDADSSQLPTNRPLNSIHCKLNPLKKLLNMKSDQLEKIENQSKIEKITLPTVSTVNLDKAKFITKTIELPAALEGKPVERSKKYTDLIRDSRLTLDDYEEMFKESQLENFTQDIEKFITEKNRRQRTIDEGMSAVGIEDDDEDEHADLLYDKGITNCYDDILMTEETDMYSSVSCHDIIVETTFTDDEQTLYSSPIPMEFFKSLRIDPTVKGFYAKANYIINAVNLLVEPHIDLHMNAMTDLCSKIQKEVNRSNGTIEIEVGMVCLALYKTDGLFYRAVVKSYDLDRDEVTVVYVDYANSSIIRSKDVRRCPAKLLTIPLRNVQIKLVGLRINPRLRENDVERKLAEVLQDNLIYIQILAHADVLRVKIYETKDCEDVIYRDLITDRYYLPLK